MVLSNRTVKYCSIIGMSSANGDLPSWIPQKFFSCFPFVCSLFELMNDQCGRWICATRQCSELVCSCSQGIILRSQAIILRSHRILSSIQLINNERKFLQAAQWVTQHRRNAQGSPIKVVHQAAILIRLRLPLTLSQHTRRLFPPSLPLWIRT
jgi:hypothetical protein